MEYADMKIEKPKHFQEPETGSEKEQPDIVTDEFKEEEIFIDDEIDEF